MAFERYRICEFDKYAIASYNAVHGTNFPASDITKITADDLAIVDTDAYCYILTYSFPCQDLSCAGKMLGMGKGTRSGLLWEVERLLDECTELPQVLLMGNVTQVHGKKNADNFAKWCDKLQSLGYKNYWRDLNAKNFGIPQSRNRTFMVSLLGDYNYEFPAERPLECRLKDVLEDEVEEKYYLSKKMQNYLFTITEKNKERGNGNLYSPSDLNGVSKTITTKEGSRVKDNFNECLAYDEQNCLVRQDGCIGTLTTDGSSPKHNNHIIEVWDGYNQRVRAEKGIVGTLTQNCGADFKRNGQAVITYDGGLRIRKLTPKECWRLMGFTDEDFAKAKQVCSDSQLYKQAGNSIVVDVLEAIFKKLL